MSLEARATFQILSLTPMESLVWHQRLVRLCSTRCHLKIFHSIEIKTTLPRSSNPSGSYSLQIIFLTFLIVSIQPFLLVPLGVSTLSRRCLQTYNSYHCDDITIPLPCYILHCSHFITHLTFDLIVLIKNPANAFLVKLNFSFATLASSGVFITSILK